MPTKNTFAEIGGAGFRGAGVGFNDGWTADAIRGVAGWGGYSDPFGNNDDTEQDRILRQRLLTDMLGDPKKKESAAKILSEALGVKSMEEWGDPELATQRWREDKNQAIFKAFEADNDLRQQLLNAWDEEEIKKQAGDDPDKLNELMTASAVGRGVGEYGSDGVAIGAGATAAAVAAPFVGVAGGTVGAVKGLGLLGATIKRAGQGLGVARHAAYNRPHLLKDAKYAAGIPVAGAGGATIYNDGYQEGQSIEERQESIQDWMLWNGVGAGIYEGGVPLARFLADKGSRGWKRLTGNQPDPTTAERVKAESNFSPSDIDEFRQNEAAGAVGTAAMPDNMAGKFAKVAENSTTNKQRQFAELSELSRLRTADSAIDAVEKSVDVDAAKQFAKTADDKPFKGGVFRTLQRSVVNKMKQGSRKFEDALEGVGDDVKMVMPSPKKVPGMQIAGLPTALKKKINSRAKLSVREAMNVASELRRNRRKFSFGPNASANSHLIGEYLEHVETAIEKTLTDGKLGDVAAKHKDARKWWGENIAKLYRSPLWQNVMNPNKTGLTKDDGALVGRIVKGMGKRNGAEMIGDFRLLYGDRAEGVIQSLGESFLLNKVGNKFKDTEDIVGAWMKNPLAINNMLGKAKPAKNYLLNSVQERIARQDMGGGVIGKDGEDIGIQMEKYIDLLIKKGRVNYLMDEGQYANLQRLRDSLHRANNRPAPKGQKGDIEKTVGDAVNGLRSVYWAWAGQRRIQFLGMAAARGAVSGATKRITQGNELTSLLNAMIDNKKILEAVVKGETDDQLIKRAMNDKFSAVLPTLAAWNATGDKKFNE